MGVITVEPARLDFVVRRGSTLRRSVTWYSDPVWTDRTETELNTGASTPVDLTGYTGRMQIRKADRTNELVQELTTENGGLTFGDVAGTITFFISDTDTELFTDDDNVYDFEIVEPGGDVVPFLAGKFTMQDQITV
jgi:hypothetical protein